MHRPNFWAEFQQRLHSPREVQTSQPAGQSRIGFAHMIRAKSMEGRGLSIQCGEEVDDGNGRSLPPKSSKSSKKRCRGLMLLVVVVRSWSCSCSCGGGGSARGCKTDPRNRFGRPTPRRIRRPGTNAVLASADANHNGALRDPHPGVPHTCFSARLRRLSSWPTRTTIYSIRPNPQQPPTGRSQLMSDMTYDMSLRDILDNNLDMIFRQPEQTLYWRIDNTSPVLLVCLVCLPFTW